MPELPEVETVRRTLEAKLAGLIFTGGEILLPKIVRTPDPQKFIELIKNKNTTGEPAWQIPSTYLK